MTIAMNPISSPAVLQAAALSQEGSCSQEPTMRYHAWKTSTAPLPTIHAIASAGMAVVELTQPVVKEYVQHGRSKLTPEEVQKIRVRYRDNEHLTYKQLAKEYGLSVLAMNLLITGKTWKNVPGAQSNNKARGVRKGPLHPKAQLTPALVRQMYNEYTNNDLLTYGDLAQKYKVSRQVVASAFQRLGEWLPDEKAEVPKRHARGARRGQRHPFALVDDAGIQEMRELRASDPKTWTLSALGSRYAVCPSMVSRVVRGMSRRDAGGPITAA